MLHGATGREVERLGAGGDRRGESGALLLHRTEVGRQLIEVVLTPLFIRMMVALGALQARAQEQLTEHRGQFGWLPAIAINHGRPGPMIRTLGEDDVPHELVIRTVGAELFANPLIQQEHALHAHAIRIRPQQVGPFVRPVVGVGGVLQNLRDPALPLPRIRIGGERPHFLRRGQQADGVQL